MPLDTVEQENTRTPQIKLCNARQRHPVWTSVYSHCCVLFFPIKKLTFRIFKKYKCPFRRQI